jgi:hypothetical protein
LKALVLQGASVVLAAAVLRRTTTSTRSQASKLRTPFPSMRAFRQRWADSPQVSSDTITGTFVGEELVDIHVPMRSDDYLR